MAKTKKVKRHGQELDSIYLLKMILYLILGSFWVRVTSAKSVQVPVPAGLIIGVVLATREKFQIDRKIEYAILLMAAFIGFWLPIGLNVIR